MTLLILAWAGVNLKGLFLALPVLYFDACAGFLPPVPVPFLAHTPICIVERAIEDHLRHLRRLLLREHVLCRSLMVSFRLPFSLHTRKLITALWVTIWCSGVLNVFLTGIIIKNFFWKLYIPYQGNKSILNFEDVRKLRQFLRGKIFF